MSTGLNRRDFAVNSLLAALGATLALPASADEPSAGEVGAASFANLRAVPTVRRRAGYEGLPCAPADGPANPVVISVDVVNDGELGAELAAISRVITARLTVHALIAGESEPWQLQVVREGCPSRQSRVVRHEAVPLAPGSTVVVGSWRVIWPAGLQQVGAQLQFSGTVETTKGALVLTSVTVPLPVDTTS